MKKVTFLLLFFILNAAVGNTQPPSIKITATVQDALAESIYGLFLLNCQIQLLQDSAYALYMPRTKKVQIRFDQSNWVEYPNRFDWFDIHDRDPETWDKNWVYQVPVDLSYVYLKTDSTLFEIFALSGGKVWLKFGAEFVDTSTNSRVFIESDAIQVQVPPCQPQEIDAFKKLRVFVKDYEHLTEMLLPDLLGPLFSSEQYFKLLANDFPETMIGAMAKCNLANIYCRLYRKTVVPPDIQTQIDQIYQDLSTHPSAYIRMQADKQIRCHN